MRKMSCLRSNYITCDLEITLIKIIFYFESNFAFVKRARQRRIWIYILSQIVYSNLRFEGICALSNGKWSIKKLTGKWIIIVKNNKV